MDTLSAETGRDVFADPFADLQALIEYEIEQAYNRGVADGLARAALDRTDPPSRALDAAVDAVVSTTQPAFIPGRAVVAVYDKGIFHRADHQTRPDFPTALRIEANRPLGDGEVDQLAHLVAYTFAATVRGDGTGKPERDSAYSFVMDADTSASHRSDPMAALDQFEIDLDAYLLDGTPVRRTNRAGVGTAGTRAVEGLRDPALRLAVYYDKVTQD